MKNSKTKIRFLQLMVCVLSIFLIAAIACGTIAYYKVNSRAGGSAILDKGIYLTVTNIDSSATGSELRGDLQYYTNGVVNVEDLAPFHVDQVDPKSSYLIATPRMEVGVKSIDFYARAKLEVIYYDLDEGISTYVEVMASELGTTDKEVMTELFASGDQENTPLAFTSNWVFRDGYFYYVKAGENKVTNETLQAIKANDIIDIFAEDSITFADYSAEKAGPFGIDKVEFKFELNVIETNAANEWMLVDYVAIDQLTCSVVSEIEKTLRVTAYNGSETTYAIAPTYVIDGKTYTVTEIGDISLGSSLDYVATKVILPETVKVINTGAFCNNSVIEEVVMQEGVENIAMLSFAMTPSLKNITIPGSVKNIEANAFMSSGLKQITLNEGLEFIGIQAFSVCENLTSITIPSSVSHIGVGIATQATNLTQLKVNERNVHYYSKNNCIIETENNTLIAVGASINAVPSGVEVIGEFAFEERSDLTSLTIPDGVVEIKDQAIFNCDNIAEISLPNTLKVIEQDFSSTTWAQNLTNGIAVARDGVTKYVIKAPTSTASIDLTNVKAIANGAFNGCTSLQSVTIPSTITHIPEKAFYGCTNLATLSLPNTITGIGNDAFINTAWLTNLKTNSGGVATATDGSTKYLIRLPSTATTIPNYSLYKAYPLDCLLGSGITEYAIPEDVTVVDEYFTAETPLPTSSLTTLIFHENVTTIGESGKNISLMTLMGSAFLDIHTLTTLVFKSTTPPEIINSAFYCNDDWDIGTHIKITTIYVPTGCVDVYKNYLNSISEYWENVNIIEQ